ncbi:LOW QUALITY PROTEIN: hypothetical protein YC2023_008354 [Brassica napus]
MDIQVAKAGGDKWKFLTNGTVQGTNSIAGTVEGAVGYAGHKVALRMWSWLKINQQRLLIWWLDTQKRKLNTNAKKCTRYYSAYVRDLDLAHSSTIMLLRGSQETVFGFVEWGEEEKLPGFVTESRRCYGPM